MNNMFFTPVFLVYFHSTDATFHEILLPYTLILPQKKFQPESIIMNQRENGIEKPWGPLHKEDTPGLALFCVWLYWETSYSQLIL